MLQNHLQQGELSQHSCIALHLLLAELAKQGAISRVDDDTGRYMPLSALLICQELQLRVLYCDCCKAETIELLPMLWSTGGLHKTAWNNNH